jgi:threonine dehydratase
MSTDKYIPSVESIDQASEVLKEILEPTPFQLNADLSTKYEADVFL